MGVESNFFDFGGHSLLATQVISRIRQQCAIEFPLRTLFETPTIAAIAQRIEQSQPASARPAIVPVERTGDLPLSFAQQRLWFIDQLEGAGSGYVISGSAAAHGHVGSIRRCTPASKAVVQRHESLRTTIVTVDDQPCQRILSLGSVDLPVIDLRHLPQGATPQRMSGTGLCRCATPLFTGGRSTAALHALSTGRN